MSLYIKGGSIVDRLDWVLPVTIVVRSVANLARIMPPRKHLNDNAKSSSGLPLETKVNAFSKVATRRYHQMVDANIKRDIKEIENVAW